MQLQSDQQVEQRDSLGAHGLETNLILVTLARTNKNDDECPFGKMLIVNDLWLLVNYQEDNQYLSYLLAFHPFA